jgi:hypothetical protein
MKRLSRYKRGNATGLNGLSAPEYAVGGWGGCYETVELLVEAGINLGAVEELIAYGR